MVELRWIKMFLFLILGLQFTAVTGQTFLYITVRDGDEATLSCKNVMTDQNNCVSTTWLFNHSTNTAAVELIEPGQIGENAKAKSDRLSVTANCSLVIKKVTVEDVGRYTCREYGRTRQQQGQHSLVFLSVVSMTEHKDTDKVKLSCSVSTYDECRHTVKWVYTGEDRDKNVTQISQSTCSATVVMLTSHFLYKSNSKFLQCEVTHVNSREVQLYNFSSQLSSTKPAVTGQTSLYITVRDGDEATLSCETVMTDQDKCTSTTWIFTCLRGTATVTLFENGQIKNGTAKSERLSVTADCSLVIKKVKVEDVGRYTCRQFDRSGQQQGQDSVVYLSVVSMTEHKDAAEVKLSCSVSTNDECKYTVKWLYNGNEPDNNNKELQTSQSTCSATVSMLTSHFIYTSKSKFLQCKVEHVSSGKVQLYNFSPQLSGDDATTTPMTQTADVEEPSAEQKNFPSWIKFIIAAVGLASLLVLVLVLIRWRKSKRNKTKMEENVDPEEGVSYASVSYTKKTNSKAQVRDDDEEGDAVTYSTVKASSSSAGASTDPSSLYATVN